MPFPAVGDLAFEVDVCSFRGDDGPYEEVALRFPAAQLAFKLREDGLFAAHYIPRLQIFDADGSIVKKMAGERVFVSVQNPPDANLFVDDIARFQLPPGRYRAGLEIEDVESRKKGQAEFDILVPE
ncbi:MAG: hypothetical protein QGG64_29660, partial [Candidatus Latescibacteria bacterium]|nr:hypothetical protein [Candidatus Latescibacterota bacterium]